MCKVCYGLSLFAQKQPKCSELSVRRRLRTAAGQRSHEPVARECLREQDGRENVGMKAQYEFCSPRLVRTLPDTSHMSSQSIALSCIFQIVKTTPTLATITVSIELHSSAVSSKTCRDHCAPAWCAPSYSQPPNSQRAAARTASPFSRCVAIQTRCKTARAKSSKA